MQLFWTDMKKYNVAKKIWVKYPELAERVAYLINSKSFIALALQTLACGSDPVPVLLFPQWMVLTVSSRNCCEAPPWAPDSYACQHLLGSADSSGYAPSFLGRHSWPAWLSGAYGGILQRLLVGTVSTVPARAAFAGSSGLELGDGCFRVLVLSPWSMDHKSSAWSRERSWSLVEEKWRTFCQQATKAATHKPSL